MTAKKKVEPKGAPEAEAVVETPQETTAPKSIAVGGLSELQAEADQITARGYTGPEKENQ
jgi:hypothetical protein